MNKLLLITGCSGVLLGWSLSLLTRSVDSVPDDLARNEVTVQDQPVCPLPHCEEQQHALPVATQDSSRIPLSNSPSDNHNKPSPGNTSSSPWDEVFSDSEEIPTLEEMERRFGGLDLQGVLAATAGISWVLQREGQEVFDEKYELGIYETAPVVDGQGPLQRAPKDGSLRGVQVRFRGSPSGEMLADVIEALPSDSPFMAARYEELRWLHGRKAVLEKGPSDK